MNTYGLDITNSTLDAETTVVLIDRYMPEIVSNRASYLIDNNTTAEFAYRQGIKDMADMLRVDFHTVWEKVDELAKA